MSTATEPRTGIYEAMFLVSQSEAAQFASLIEHIEDILSRGGAEIVSMRKWDERRLAYEIEKQKRGVYILVYLRCPTDSVAKIERDVQISERIMRMLITKADHLSPEEIASADDREGLAVEAKLRAEKAAADSEQASGKVRLGAPVAEEAAVPAADDPAAAAPEANSEAGPGAPSEPSPEGEAPKPEGDNA